MATPQMLRPEDRTVSAMVIVDELAHLTFGSDESRWTEDQRNGYVTAVQEARAHPEDWLRPEARPVRPRAASAGRRRRYVKQLRWEIGKVASGAQTVMLTPITWADEEPTRWIYRALVRDADGQALTLAQGGTERLTTLLQAAYPRADWGRPQTWHADSNRLTTWGQASRNFRDSDDAGYVVGLDAYSIRLAAGEARDA